ncbi:MAG: malate synthase A [Candidatus Sericytochromatia bacterium]|nr:malate synthase A [Candidatus Sericytochromatia bacterium]
MDASATARPAGLEVVGPVRPGSGERVLTPGALAFLADLGRTFEPRRQALLAARQARRARLHAGERPGFAPETLEIRQTHWHVAPPPADLLDRRVEITGPPDRKMIINALNSGARVFMADLEDATSPTWANVLDGHANLMDAVARSITHTAPDGRGYALGEALATLVVRPRGWHLDEPRLRLDGAPLSASLVDFGLYLFHNHGALRARGSGPYYYLPKLEGHREARLWREVFVHAERSLGLAHGTIRCTVLIETVLAAFEMEEILFELRDHATGLNAGRWDYLFSIIKQLGEDPAFVLPDRARVTMAAPFMRAYCQLLVRSCHRHRAHAIGGMSAFIPHRGDPAINARAIAQVREDKEREAGDGFDGTWVAHPDLVPVAREVFDRVLVGLPHQLGRWQEDIVADAAHLLDMRVPGAAVTEAGVRDNVHVALVYLAEWLAGRGAVPIHHRMEDAATAELARAQLWQWLRHGTPLAGGGRVTRALYERLRDEERAKLSGDGRLEAAVGLLDELVLASGFVEFLTGPATVRLLAAEAG